MKCCGNSQFHWIAHGKSWVHLLVPSVFVVCFMLRVITPRALAYILRTSLRPESYREDLSLDDSTSACPTSPPRRSFIFLCASAS